jgi:hypothetical protein
MSGDINTKMIIDLYKTNCIKLESITRFYPKDKQEFVRNSFKQKLKAFKLLYAKEIKKKKHITKGK